MKPSPTKLITGIFLPLLLVVGIASGLAAKQALMDEETQSSPFDEKVTVMIVIPEGKKLTGTAIITLEDITLQDAQSVELASVITPASKLINDQITVEVPIDLRLVNPDAIVNVAVHIDSDDSGDLSNGDWISDSLVSVITNATMIATIDIIQIGVN